MPFNVDVQGNGPPVVLLHGLGASIFTWRAVVPALSPTCRTYALDLLGFGASPAPAGFACTMAAQAAEVAAWIQAEGLADVRLVGHSMGGGICLGIAAMAAAGGAFTVSKMALLAPVAYAPPTSPAGLQVPGLGGALGAALAPIVGATLASAILSSAYANPAAITAAQRSGYARQLSKPSQLRAFSSHARNLSISPVPAANYPTLRTDTLVVWGQDDPFLPFAHGQQLTGAAGLPRGTLHPVANCGHIVHEEREAESIAALQGFLP